MAAEAVLPRPPYDAELAPMLDVISTMLPPTLTADMLPALRQGTLPGMPSAEEVLAKARLRSRDVTIAGYRGGEIVVSVIEAEGRTGHGPGILHTHGGGMIMGDRFGGIAAFAEWLHRYDGVLVSVEYRLAPEFPDPYPVEDCYAGLVWTAENAEEIGLEAGRLLIAGASAGGGLAAGVALLARDRQGPPLLGQMLLCPMLDDRDATVSTRQYEGIGVWDRGSNLLGWGSLLGDRRGTPDVSIYAAPARATDLSGLPPAYIDCGSAEVFRDEDVAYASAIWASGGQAELHVWPGGFHGFDGLAPQAALSHDVVDARDRWIRRLLG
ncbi:esterase [Cnuibacter physcomitrellae]|uniref:Lipase n=1 Tax=Cnuibacter physcomitrellae TaxID=1619308 RepID=A0A1X9LNQ9_9MICO|nr:alpha/beta hydrolase [Cnuibacter physcomitrellae]ARJ06844.1 lipase [Cnuibacter physcomitrellae]GGI38966.1 esterase [Cnuibacter physcomitrellae]